MEVLDHFSIPFMGLKVGLHQLKFEVDNAFFSQFENTMIQKGDLNVILDLDKRSDMSILDFKIEGTVLTDCDRCMEPIYLPVSGVYRLHAKYTEDTIEGDDEVVYIHPQTSKLNVAQYVYEYIHISLPMIKTYDCKSDPNANCNEIILDRFEEESDEDNSNPIWDKLNDLKLDQ